MKQLKSRALLLSLVAILFAATTADSFAQLSLEVVWEKPQAGVIDAKFSPDGKFIYCAIGADIKKLDVATGEFVATFDKGGLTEASLYLEISPDGKKLLNCRPGGVYLWDTEQMKLDRRITSEVLVDGKSFYLSSFAPDSRHILITLYTGHPFPQKPTNEILLFDLLENKVIKKIPYDRIEQLHYSKDGKYFITGTKYEGKPKVTLWDANTLKPIRDYEVPEGNDDGFRKIQLSDNNLLIGLATHNSNIVKILETETGNVVKTSDVSQIGLNFCLLSNDYYLIYQEVDITNYGIYFYQYPDIYQSSLMRDGSRIIISIKSDDDKIVIFQETYQSIALLKSSTTSVPKNQLGHFIIKVEPEKITVNFENADTVRILDMKGDVLLDQKVNEPNITIPNTFIAGTYIFVVKSGGREYSQKFQVLR